MIRQLVHLGALPLTQKAMLAPSLKITQPLTTASVPTLSKAIAVTQPKAMVAPAPVAAPTPTFSLPSLRPAPMPAAPPDLPLSLPNPNSATSGGYMPAPGSDIAPQQLDPAPVVVTPGRFDVEKRLLGVPLKTWLLGGAIIGGGVVVLRILR